MHKIEEQMIEAIKTRKGCQRGNTLVLEPNHWDWQPVYLYGNLIAASRIGIEDGRLQTQVEKTTFRRWPTRTTVSRLRALGINASVRKGVAMIDGQPV